VTRVFVYEYTCATWRPGAEASRAGSLTAEGRAMLAAAANDFAALDDVETIALISPPLADIWKLPSDNARDLKTITDEDDEAGFRAAADACDFALVIAPEFDAILETRCRWAEQCRAALLGPCPDTVALCADKLMLGELWTEARVPTPVTRLFDARAFPPPVVVKPRFGAGSQETIVCTDQQSLVELGQQRGAIVQPYCDGLPMSQAFIIGPGQRIALAPCSQSITPRRNRLLYEGGRTANCAPFVERVGRVARQAVEAVPGLFGYVGVDVIIRSSAPDLAIEINPRLTTSYLGLRQLCQQNLMGLLLDAVRGIEVREPAWHADDVRF